MWLFEHEVEADLLEALVGASLLLRSTSQLELEVLFIPIAIN